MGGASSGRVKKRSKRASAREPTASMHRGARSASSHATKARSIGAVFDKFKEENGEKMGPEGVMEFFKAVRVDPLDVATLIFAWKIKAQVPCEFSRAEFVDGCLSLGCDTLEKLRRVIPTLSSHLSNKADFRKFYMFAFDYNKPPEQRSLPLETAKQLFPLILAGRFAYLDLWLQFLDTRKHAISRDSFALLLDFADGFACDRDLAAFDEANGAWPVLLDEFVDFARAKLGIDKAEEGGQEDDEDDY